MNIKDRILDFILGAKLISVIDAKTDFNDALDKCDVDKDGYINVRELITFFKEMVKSER